MEMFRRTYADINIEHLVHNWGQIKKVAGDDRFICPMVKANAYGHGDIQVAQALEREGALGVGVCLIEEGLLLRAAGIKTDILVFRGFDKRGAEKILEYQLIPVVSTWEQIYSLEAAADEAVKVHLKFNTGMNRIGFNSDQAEKLDEYFSKSKKLKLKALLSHFAVGEDSHLPNGVSATQMNEFLKILEFFKSRGVYSHLLNSGGIAGLAKAHTLTTSDKNTLIESHNWGFRPGLMLYGYQSATHFSEIDLKPVMSLKSVVNNIRLVKAGESVSYGCTWTATRPSRIAVVPIGYADGVHRLVSNKSHALFAGQKVPIVGRVCMDFLMLDVTDVVKDSDTNRWIEEDVVLFGFDEKNNFLSGEEMAANTNTIVWETLTSVGERVPRHFKGLKKT
ncbi:MAG: alanine racemase [Pseudobdellovibrio sp.]